MAQDLYGWYPSNRPAGLLDSSTQAAQQLANSPRVPAGVLAPGGAYSQAALGLAGSPRMAPPGGGAAGGFLGAMPGSDGGGSDPTENNRFQGAASGAAAGSKFGPWGALVGGIIGYGAEGGVKDANPYDASGFSGVSMDRAWEDQNLARLASNPAGALASKLGVSSDSFFGKALDPSGILGGGLFRSKNGDEKRNLNAFLQETPVTDLGDGQYALPDGVKINADQLKNLAGSWYGATYAPDGNQEGWRDKYNEVLQDIYSQPMYFGD
jgi:hypothetical protein